MNAWRQAGCPAAVVLSVLCGTAAGQETRADLIAEEQADKATRLRPYEPSAAERLVTRAGRMMLESPAGFFPAFGSVYAGGGLALGGGYRQYYGDRTFWDVRGLFSIRSYKLAEMTTSSPGHLQDRLDLYARAGWRDATEVAFYGTGIGSPEDGRANFQLRESYLTAGARLRPVRWVVLGTEASYQSFTTGEGAGIAPSIEQVFTPLTAPGLGANPKYVHLSASGGIDWRPAAGYARRGGLYELSYHKYADRDGVHSFDRVDAQLVQHIPLLRENWVLSFRGQVQTTLEETDVVPYFMMPSLGSGSTLRAYSSWRYHDRHSLLMSGEWRWIVNRLGFDMALFYDTGKVASRRGNLNLNGLKSNVGVGARFHSPAATALRIELAFGEEGPRLVFTGGAAF